MIGVKYSIPSLCTKKSDFRTSLKTQKIYGNCKISFFSYIKSLMVAGGHCDEISQGDQPPSCYNLGYQLAKASNLICDVHGVGHLVS